MPVSGLWRSLVAHLAGGQGVVGSNPASPTPVMSQDIPDRVNLRGLPCLSFGGVSAGLVVVVGVEV